MHKTASVLISTLLTHLWNYLIYIFILKTEKHVFFKKKNVSVEHLISNGNNINIYIWCFIVSCTLSEQARIQTHTKRFFVINITHLLKAEYIALQDNPKSLQCSFPPITKRSCTNCYVACLRLEFIYARNCHTGDCTKEWKPVFWSLFHFKTILEHDQSAYHITGNSEFCMVLK